LRPQKLRKRVPTNATTATKVPTLVEVVHSAGLKLMTLIQRTLAAGVAFYPLPCSTIPLSWGRPNKKDQILQAIQEATGAPVKERLRSLKKQDLAGEAEKSVTGTRRLPELLRK
jgi:hypothetical protein